MNASPLPADRSPAAPLGAVSSTSPQVVSKGTRPKSLRSLLGTITGICFLFGGLLAVQLRTIENARLTNDLKKQNDTLQKEMAEKNLAKAEIERHAAEKRRLELAATISTLGKEKSLSEAQIKALTAQIKDLQFVAGLTTVKGAGVRLILSDNSQASQAGGDPSLPLPGLVHDYDVLQVVNELRAAKADAIAVSGAGGKAIRITGTTPIRCVGPVIFINWKPVAAPFTIEAVGESGTLKSALNMPGGIVENMRVQGAIGVKLDTVNTLILPPSESAPTISGTNIETRMPLADEPVKKGT